MKRRVRSLRRIQFGEPIFLIPAPPAHCVLTQSHTLIPSNRSGETQADILLAFSEGADLVLVCDPDGVVRAVSPSVTPLLGWEPADLTGAELRSRIHPADWPRIVSMIRRLEAGEMAERIECRLATTDGGHHLLEWNVCISGDGSRVIATGRTTQTRSGPGADRRGRDYNRLRLRTATELHDGVLQTLTAASLHLAVARKKLEVDVAGADEALARLIDILSAEQKELRLYVDEIENPGSSWNDGRRALESRVRDMLERIRAIWGVDHSIEVVLNGHIDPEMERQVLRVIQEAIVNAARHGGASLVQIALGIDEHEIRIQMTDDGRGFPFKGSYSDAELRAQRVGPLSIKTRVAAAGGTISIDSTSTGAVVDVRMPTRSHWVQGP